MTHLLPLLLVLFLGCGAGYTGTAGEARPIAPTPTYTPVPPSGAVQQQFIRGVVEYGATVKQVSVKPRGRDIYAEIMVEKDVAPSEAEAVLDHGLETLESSLSSEPEWYNYHIRVLRPDGSGVVSVAADAPQMFEHRR